MGFFSGLRDRWNDGSLLNSLQMAGATAQGDYGTAASIGQSFQHQRQLQQEADREAQERQAAAQAEQQQQEAIYNGLRQRNVPEEEARALARTAQGASVLGSYNNQQTPDAAARLLSAHGYTDPSQPGYREAEQAARSFGMGQPVTDSDGRASMATPNIVPAREYAAQNAPPPPPVLGNVVDYNNAADVLMQGGTAQFNQMVDSGAVVRVSSPSQARNLPRGTRILMPDGTIGVVQ